MRYQAVIFDLDGTLLNTLSDMHTSVNATMAHYHLPVHSREEVRQFVGNGAKVLIQRCLPFDVTEARLAEITDFYVSHYAAHVREHTAPYPGLLALLSQLKVVGSPAAVVSNKPDGSTRQMAEHYFPGLLTLAVGDCPGQRKKPHPDSVCKVLQTMGLTARQAVYVGDSEVDVATARNAGLDCIAVTWGFRSRKQLEESGAVLFANNAQELSDLLLTSP